jgi:hypothetical protein
MDIPIKPFLLTLFLQAKLVKYRGEAEEAKSLIGGKARDLRLST